VRSQPGTKCLVQGHPFLKSDTQGGRARLRPNRVARVSRAAGGPKEPSRRVRSELAQEYSSRSSTIATTRTITIVLGAKEQSLALLNSEFCLLNSASLLFFLLQIEMCRIECDG
jgi:hypothetical protein